MTGVRYQCLLCGGQAHAYSEDGGHTLELWDLCRRCNDAFVAAAERVAAALPTVIDGPAAAALLHVAGQLELDDTASMCDMCGGGQPGDYLCPAHR